MMDKDELIQEIADTVRDSLLFCKKEVLTSEEVARYMGISKSYLYKLTSKMKIPHYKPLGTMCFFDRKEIEAWLTNNPITRQKEKEEAGGTSGPE